MRRRQYQRLLQLIPILFLAALFLSGCMSYGTPTPKCTILFEDNSDLFLPKQIYEISQLDDLTVSVGLPHGYRIASVNFDDYAISSKLSESLSYDYYELTLHHIRYSAVIRFTTARSYTTIYYKSAQELALLSEEGPHLRHNSLPYHAISESTSTDTKLPIGWNTALDGTGTHIGFGSRIDHSGSPNLNLYLDTLVCSPASDFSFKQAADGSLTITGYRGSGDLIIPGSIDGYPVTGIGENAFSDLSLQTLALPPTITDIASHAFGNVSVTDFYFFDNIQRFPEDAFQSYDITHLHINAATDPVYSGSYFDTLADKVDYLSSVRDEKKLILFCGSSARFGYDSPLLESAYPDYKVVNMRVYGYSNMLPQAKIMLQYVKPNDVVLSSPELDAIDTQFCGESALDKETFCMMESNYDMLAGLDSRDFTQIFDSFTQYNQSRIDMEPRSYSDSASYYDEDGNQLTSFSYNSYGDYIVFRKNNEDRKSFGIKRAYYNAKYIRAQDINGINAIYDALQSQGVLVLFTYSPRSNISISEDSTPESISSLEAYLATALHAEVISPIEGSLMDPYYFNGTDNHLSTEGVQLHTTNIIQELQPFLEEQP